MSSYRRSQPERHPQQSSPAEAAAAELLRRRNLRDRFAHLSDDELIAMYQAGRQRLLELGMTESEVRAIEDEMRREQL